MVYLVIYLIVSLDEKQYLRILLLVDNAQLFVKQAVESVKVTWLTWEYSLLVQLPWVPAGLYDNANNVSL
jgi:hypothetical protein